MLIDATFNLATFFYHTSTLASSVSASSPVAAVAAVAVAGRPTCGDQGIKAAPATAPLTAPASGPTSRGNRGEHPQLRCPGSSSPSGSSGSRGPGGPVTSTDPGR